MIHKTAMVSKKADIGKNVDIGPNCVIEGDVTIGDGTKIWHGVYVASGTSIGKGNVIHMGAVLGHQPQHLGFKGQKGFLKIGNDNIIREYVTIHRAHEEGQSTTIGNKNYLMGLSHVAHDCKIGDEVVMCNNALLAGYVELGDKVFMGGGSAVHQFARVGTVAMVGGLTRVNQDVVPYTLIECDAEVRGLNTVGMKRANIKPEARSQIKQAYKILYLSGLSIPSALERIQAMPDPANEITVICEFIRRSKRGICMHKKKS